MAESLSERCADCWIKRHCLFYLCLLLPSTVCVTALPCKNNYQAYIFGSLCMHINTTLWNRCPYTCSSTGILRTLTPITRAESDSSSRRLLRYQTCGRRTRDGMSVRSCFWTRRRMTSLLTELTTERGSTWLSIVSSSSLFAVCTRSLGLWHTRQKPAPQINRLQKSASHFWRRFLVP